MIEKKSKIETHRFLDEAGDTTVYGKGKVSAIGSDGVSNCFIIGMVKFKEKLDPVREKIKALQLQISNDPYYNVPSIQKKKTGSGYYLHATDDIPEVRKMFFDLIKGIDCSFEAVVSTKSIEKFELKYHGKEQYYYADLLSHLLKNKFTQKEDKLVLHISGRGKSTKNTNLELAVAKAKERFTKRHHSEEITTNVVFNIEYPTQEPLLNVADYFCWSIQRIFEKGETRYYDYIKEKVSLVIDLDDTEKYIGFRNYYRPKNPLTTDNKKSPHVH